MNRSSISKQVGQEIFTERKNVRGEKWDEKYNSGEEEGLENSPGQKNRKNVEELQEIFFFFFFY